MHHQTSQNLEASGGQEEPKLGKTDGFRIRQMQKGETQNRQKCMSTLGPKIHIYWMTGSFRQHLG